MKKNKYLRKIISFCAQFNGLVDDFETVVVVVDVETLVVNFEIFVDFWAVFGIVALKAVVVVIVAFGAVVLIVDFWAVFVIFDFETVVVIVDLEAVAIVVDLRTVLWHNVSSMKQRKKRKPVRFSLFNIVNTEKTE